MEDKRSIARSIIDHLGISRSINNIVIEEIDSPWQEKALIKRKKGSIDVKALVWNDEAFLYGRIYRLFLYIADVLDASFQYNPLITPDEEKEPRIRDRYNQIWSLYVDSRMERLAIESFFDGVLRKNLFIDLERGLGWKEAGNIFNALWAKEVFTYPEIIDLAYHLEERFPELKEPPGTYHVEKDIAVCLQEPSVKKHMERLSSPTLAAILNDLLSFAAYSCKDTMIVPCHYGIVFLFQRKVFIELIPSQDKTLTLSVLDSTSNKYETLEITEGTDLEEVQKKIQHHYTIMTMHTKSELGGG